MPSRDTNIIKLHTDICNNNRDIARQLISIARKIKNGDWGNVRVAITVMDTDEGVRRVTMGPVGINNVEVVGLLNWSAHKCIDGV